MQSTQKKLAKVLATLVVGTSCFSAAFSNDEQYLSNDPININGYITEEAPVSDAELENVKNELRKQKTTIIINKEKKKKYNQLSKSTEKLADVTEDMIEERKESQVTIDKFNKKIDCLMAEGRKAGCEAYLKSDKEDVVKVQQAAPVVQKKVEARINTNEFGGEIRVLPYSGLTTFMSENENLEAGFVGGIKAETNISDRFSVGLGFTYANMTTEDYGGNEYFFNNFNFQNNYNNFYNGREIEYKNFKFDLYSKFYMVTKKRLRPYIGAGIGYNRSTLNYTNNENSAGCFYNDCTYAFGNEKVITSNISLDLMIGSEIRFTESFGANLELNYSTGFGSNLSSEKGIDAYKAPDQKRLEDLSDELSDAHIVSLFAGIMVNF